MSNHGAPITFEGNVTADPDVRTSPTGDVACNFTVAVTPRMKMQDGQYGDGPTGFYRVTAWRKLGEGTAESIHKGTRVVVVGRLKPRPFEHNGEQWLSLDVTAESVGLSTLFMGGANGGGQQSGGFGGQPQADPWASGGNTGGQQSGGWDQQSPTEPPF